jgi:4-aminobutyrate aminotransferase-like enzyme/Ser/Thr protein kinase RdoA (MazF antagonist)
MLLLTRVANAVSEATAAELAREIYGIRATAKALPGEYDDNFHLVDDDGRAFVLKVMHPARQESFVDMQAQALRVLTEKLPHRRLPRVISTKDQETFTTIPAGDSERRMVWMLSYVAGKMLAEVHPHSDELLRGVGSLLGEMDAALAGFTHPAAHAELKWDSARAAWIGNALEVIEDDERRALVGSVVRLYEAEVTPMLGSLRRSVIYGDANDHNVLVSEGWPREVCAVIDFGDMHYGLTVAEPAIAAAYAALGKNEPLAAAAAVIAGYHRANRLSQAEVKVVFPLLAMRLAVSVVISAERKQLRPDDTYLTISEAPAWRALEQLANINRRFAEYTFREACGFAEDARCARVTEYLQKSAARAAAVLGSNERVNPVHVLDLSVGSTLLGADPAQSELPTLSDVISRELNRTAATIGVGRYNEARLVYQSPLFQTSQNPTDEQRTIHLGLDLFAPANTTVHAPLAGTVEAFANNREALDYGPVVILQHATDGGEIFHTLYGHLSTESLQKLELGKEIQEGEKFGQLGTAEENGGWPPHLHFQIIPDLLGLGTDFPGVARASERGVWTKLSPDPNLLLNIPAKYFPETEATFAATRAARGSSFAKNVSVSYQRPLKIVRGWKQFLYDETGRAYLDVYNNVPLVGHSHPRVVRAVQAQIGLLNTNTRYLHDNATRYAERLKKLLPAQLEVCFFLNSGSEANELALRLARTHTSREDVLVLEHAYHGHTSTLIDISPYKFNGPGGTGRKESVHVAPLADDYRGTFRREDPEAGEKYARAVQEVIHEAGTRGRKIAAFIAETLPSVGGQVVFPANYLLESYRYVRAAGGVCIADEVQVGFGRLGTHFWGFETQGVVPDIVVLGKPIGNAFPLAAVVTTAEIAESFANGMEFFSTFGGNPVACAAGLAVLDVLRDEQLQQNALRVGNYFKAALLGLQEKFPIIGDVRGSGLFLGVDLVVDRESRAAASQQADYIVNRLRECGILAGADGPFDNVLKLRPPLIFGERDAQLFLATLEGILREDAAQPV